ncbi:MAG: AAA family ATPase [Chthoniobacteraceae bacterium]|jgi:hypothetical protein
MLVGATLHLPAGGQNAPGNIHSLWRQAHFTPAAGIFATIINTEGRLNTCSPPQNISFVAQAITHPIQRLARDDRLEFKISKYFKEAFGKDLVVHRNAGGTIPLYCGIRPIPPPGKDRHSFEYVQEIEKLDPVHKQGDGIRSYIGVLLQVLVGEWSLVLLDEPEAFLHPPQARLLGTVLASERLPTTQAIIATHSGDFLKGVLDAGRAQTRVLRLTRNENVNCVKELQAGEIKDLWTDPLLRYSNVLDGLFHESVVLCESDSDCLLYGAVLDDVCKAKDRRRPDLLFLHCGGKARMPVVIRALKRVGVPISTVVDFDILSEERPLRDIVETHGGDWTAIEPLWRAVHHAMSNKKPELSTDETRNQITKILESVKEPVFPKSEARKIDALLRRATPWQQVKSIGLNFLRGDTYGNGETLLLELAKLGIHVVPVGELESFFPAANNHGPAFVADVLERGMLASPAADEAKRFVEKVVFSA